VAEQKKETGLNIRITRINVMLAVLLQLSCNVFADHFIFGPSMAVIDGRSNASAVKPGDTIYISGSRQLVILRSIHGTQSAPVSVQNLGGQVVFSGSTYGIKFDTCSWVNLSGKGTDTAYGFVCHSVNAGVIIGGLSTCIEVSGVEIYNTTWTGIDAKTDPDCSFLSTRDKYTMRNISIHDNYIHNTANEGMYIGSSFYYGYELSCNGKDTLVFPHLIKGLRVYNNKVESSGWDGIQVSSADSACFVNNNFIFHDSQAQVSDQMSGFMLGGGSSCNCFANLIQDGKGDGIDEMGLGGNYIYNNLILNAGQSFTGSGQKHGIFVGTQAPTAGKGFHLIFNTIVNPRSYGIDFLNTSGTDNEAVSNIIVSTNGAYINTANGSNLYQSSNLQVALTGDVKFINASAGNYDLQASSPAVNSGKAVQGFSVNSDFLGRSRPFARLYDIGAFECHDSSLLGLPEKKNTEAFKIKSFFIKDGHLYVCLDLAERNQLKASLFDISGHPIAEIVNSAEGPGLFKVDCFLGQLDNAYYICIIQFGGQKLARKIPVMNFSGE